MASHNVFAIVVVLGLAGLCTAQLFGPLVTIPGLGKLRGQTGNTLIDKKSVYRFRGIPFALPPIGEKRFMPSELNEGPLPTGITGEFNAQSYMPNCVQGNGFGSGLKGKEDCLGLNVYSPELPSGDNPTLRPVLVFIHGGAFTIGNADTYNGARVLDRDIVLVTFNYRLGVFGFLSLDIDEAPGNAALFDAITALQWIQRYIHYFGGDPNRVTISGQSAGSAVVTHLLLSPHSTGLFHGAIAMSGSAISTWGLEKNPRVHGLAVARFAGCNQTTVSAEPDLDAVAACMKSVPMASINSALQEYIKEERLNGRLGFGPTAPCIQRAGTRKFLAEDPLNILHEKRQMNVPLLAGSVKHDGSFILSLVYQAYLEPSGVLRDNYFMRTGLVPTLLSALGVNDDSFAIFEALADVYVGNQGMTTGIFDEMLIGLIDIHSVFFIKASTYRTMQLHSQLQPDTYWYSFDYHGANSLYGLLDLLAPTPVPGGISHGDELMYIFYVFFTLPGNDQVVSQRMLDHWSNFVKYGNPTPPGHSHSDGSQMTHWPAYTSYLNQYMSIDAEPTVKTNFPLTWVGAADELGPPKPPICPPCPTTNIFVRPSVDQCLCNKNSNVLYSVCSDYVKQCAAASNM